MRPDPRFLAVVIALFLGGCAATASHEDTSMPSTATAGAPATDSNTPSADADARAAIDALRYFHHAMTLPPERLRTEYLAAEQAFLNDGHPFNRIRLAILLSLPYTDFHSNANALNLLGEYLEGPSEGPLSQFAFLLATVMLEQANADQRLKTFQRKTEALQQQLNDLKSIEENLSRRQLPGAERHDGR
jgi:hypothetical protein